jgi:predicted TIM-barrel fold metal-dependent hydrolase
MVIDAHSHYLPDDARRLLQRSQGSGSRIASLRSVGDDDPIVQIESRLAEMDRLGIGVAVLALPPVGLLPDPGLAREFSMAGNDGLRSACAAHPDRFVMLASVPLPDVEASIAEVERLADEPSARGITFPSQSTLHRPDQIGVEAMLLRAADLGLVAMMHPSGANIDLGAVFDDFNLGLAMHSMISGPLAAARMIAAGFFDRIPTLALIVPSLGGILPFIADRLDDRLGGGMERTPSEYLRSNVYYDTSACRAGPAFRCTIDTVGVGQVLFGTDYPSWSMGAALASVTGMDLEQDDRRLILGGTGRQWFDPLRPRAVGP